MFHFTKKKLQTSNEEKFCSPILKYITFIEVHTAIWSLIIPQHQNGHISLSLSAMTNLASCIYQLCPVEPE